MPSSFTSIGAPEPVWAARRASPRPRPTREKSMTETARNESIDSSDGTCWRLSIGQVSDNRHSPTAPRNPVTIAAWRAAVSDDSGKAFAELVHEDVVLEGSVFASPIAGREAVRNAMRQSSRLYDRLEFTYETQSTDRTYFEWEGAALGLPVWGVTAISLGTDGLISRVVLSHRPLAVVDRFAAALSASLAPR